MNSEDTENAWRMLDAAKASLAEAQEEEHSYPIWLAASETENDYLNTSSIYKIPCEEGGEDSLYEQHVEDCPLVATDWYIHTNCGDAVKPEIGREHTTLTTYVKPGKRKSSPLEKGAAHPPHKIQKQLKTIADTREISLQQEISGLESQLRVKDPTLADLHIDACKDLYRQISLCLESEKAKKNKRKVAAASTYYTLKRFFNPSPKEIERIFDMDHKSVTDALKRVKHLAFRNPIQLGWVFQEERGATNLYRYASKENMPWSVVQSCCKFAKLKDLDLREDTVVVALLRRFGHGT